jgi:hypothetical protein
MANTFPAGENRAQRWPTIEKTSQFWFGTGDYRVHSRISFSFMQNIMQISQGLERGISQNSSWATRVQKALSSMDFTQAHSNMKASAVIMLHQFLEILQHCHATNFWIFDRRRDRVLLECPHCDVWATSRDAIPETTMTKMNVEKGMISIIWSISGIQSLYALTKGMKCKYNSQYFCQLVIPDIQQYICSSSRRKNIERYFHASWEGISS